MKQLKQDSEQLKVQIRDKYFQLGTEQGFSKVNLDQVASELSISKKTIYKFFSGKEEVISACIDHVFAGIDQEILPITNDHAIGIIEKITQLLSIVASHLNFFTKQQVVEIQRAFPDLWEQVLEQRKQRIERYEGLFRIAREKGLIIDVEPNIIVGFFLATIETFTEENFMNEHGVSYAQSLQIATHILLNGILNKPAPERGSD